MKKESCHSERYNLFAKNLSSIMLSEVEAFHPSPAQILRSLYSKDTPLPQNDTPGDLCQLINCVYYRAKLCTVLVKNNILLFLSAC